MGEVKRIIKKIASKTEFVIPGPWSLVNLVVELVVEIVNEITSAALSRQISEDPLYAMRGEPVDLSMTRPQTDIETFSEKLNALQNLTVNEQLRHVSALAATATAVNRYYTALSHHDNVASAMQLGNIREFLLSATGMEARVAELLGSFADLLQQEKSDIALNQATVRQYQADVLAHDFKPEFVKLVDGIVAKLDRQLMEIVDPIHLARQHVLGMRSEEVPAFFSEILRAEAKLISSFHSIAGPFPGVHFPGVRFVRSAYAGCDSHTHALE